MRSLDFWISWHEPLSWPYSALNWHFVETENEELSILVGEEEHNPVSGPREDIRYRVLCDVTRPLGTCFLLISRHGQTVQMNVLNKFNTPLKITNNPVTWPGLDFGCLQIVFNENTPLLQWSDNEMYMANAPKPLEWIFWRKRTTRSKSACEAFYWKMNNCGLIYEQSTLDFDGDARRKQND